MVGTRIMELFTVLFTKINMASVIGEKIIVPIGCSCITQFQLDFFYSYKKYNSQIFDWNLFTPDSLISILESSFESLVKASENIRFYRPGIVKPDNLNGYYWWQFLEYSQHKFLYSYKCSNDSKNSIEV